MGVGGLHHALAALPPGKTQYPLYKMLGRPQGWSGWVWKILPPPGFDIQTIQPVVSHYTDCAILAHGSTLYSLSWSCSWGACNWLYTCRYFYVFSVLGTSWAATTWRPTVIWHILTASCNCGGTYHSGIHKISCAHTMELCVKCVRGQDERCIK